MHLFVVNKPSTKSKNELWLDLVTCGLLTEMLSNFIAPIFTNLALNAQHIGMHDRS